MAQPTGTTITNFTQCQKLPGFYPGGWVDEFLRVVPFQDAAGYGRSVQINQASSLGTTAYYAAGDTLSATQGTTNLATMTFARVGGTAQVDDADIDASADPNDQLELQVAMRRVAVLRLLSQEALFGDGIAPNMSGLLTLADTGQKIDKAAAAPTLADYHRLVALVRASDGSVGTGADALVMNFNARRQLTSLIETSGGGTPCYEMDPTLGVPVMKFDGASIYVTDGIAAGATSTIFALKLKGPTGVRVLHADGSSDQFGIVVDEVPNQLTVSQRAKIVRGYYAMMIPEVASLAVMINASMTGFNP